MAQHGRRRACIRPEVVNSVYREICPACGAPMVLVEGVKGVGIFMSFGGLINWASGDIRIFTERNRTGRNVCPSCGFKEPVGIPLTYQ